MNNQKKSVIFGGISESIGNKNGKDTTSKKDNDW